MLANTNLRKIYLSETIRCLGLGMIDIFIPILLLTHGYSLRQVVLFYIVMSVVHMVCAIPAGWLGAKIGYKYLILLSAPFFIMFFFFLKDLGALAIPLWTLGIIREVGAVCYWVGRHSFMGFYTDKDKIGAQLGTLNIFRSIANITAPVIGGIFLSLDNMAAVIAIVSVLLIVSVIPLFFIREQWKDSVFSFRRIFSKFHFKNAPIFMVQGVDNVVTYDLVWPVYLYFFIFTKYVALGLVGFIGGTVSLLTNYIAGKFSDKNYRVTMRTGAIATLVIWCLRIFARTPVQVYAIDSVNGITDQFVQLPFGTMSYKIAKEGYFLQFIVFRELAIHSGKILTYLAILAIGSFKHALIIGLIYPLGYMIFKFHSRTSGKLAG